MVTRKKAVSPVIASVLLIVIVMVLAAIIFLWARGFKGEIVTKQGKNSDQVCREISLDASYISSNEELQIVNNGNIPIFSADSKITYDSGKEIQHSEKPINSGGSEKISLTPSGEVKEIEVFPVILGEVDGVKKAYTCKEGFIAEII